VLDLIPLLVWGKWLTVISMLLVGKVLHFALPTREGEPCCRPSAVVAGRRFGRDATAAPFLHRADVWYRKAADRGPVRRRPRVGARS